MESDNPQETKTVAVLDRVEDVLNRPIESLYDLLVNIGILLMATLVVLVTTNVILRYVFESSLFFGNAMGRYIAIWFSLLLVGPLLLHDKHLGVDVLVRKFSFRTRIAIRIVEMILIVILGGLQTYWGWQYASSFGFNTTDPATGIDMFWFYSALWVSGIFVVVFGLYKLVQILSDPNVIDRDYERQYGTGSFEEEVE
jgi:TRAP-type C4-dicarboxylate transport system permease small subunit